MPDLVKLNSQNKKLHAEEEMWMVEHKQAMQVLDVQGLVDRALGLDANVKSLLLQSADMSPEVLAGAYSLQLEFLETARGIENCARICESVGFTVDDVEELRAVLSDLIFTEQSIKDTIAALGSISEDTLVPLSEIFDGIRDRLHTGIIQ